MCIFNNYCAHAHSCVIDDKHNSVLAVFTVFQILSMNKAQEKSLENSIYYHFRSHSPRWTVNSDQVSELVTPIYRLVYCHPLRAVFPGSAV